MHPLRCTTAKLSSLCSIVSHKKCIASDAAWYRVSKVQVQDQLLRNAYNHNPETTTLSAIQDVFFMVCKRIIVSHRQFVHNTTKTTVNALLCSCFTMHDEPDERNSHTAPCTSSLMWAYDTAVSAVYILFGQYLFNGTNMHHRSYRKDRFNYLTYKSPIIYIVQCNKLWIISYILLDFVYIIYTHSLLKCRLLQWD